MKQGSSPNFKDLGSSALPKKRKTLGTRDDNTTMDNVAIKDGINTLTKTSKRGSKSSTRDISQRRADRIKRRQDRKNPPAEPKMNKTTEPVKKSGPNWDEAPAVGSPERAAWYKENNLAPDKTVKSPAPGDKRPTYDREKPDYTKRYDGRTEEEKKQDNRPSEYRFDV